MIHLQEHPFPMIRLANSISVYILDEIAIKTFLIQENCVYYDKLSYYDVYLIETSYLVVFSTHSAILFKNYEEMKFSVIDQTIMVFYDEEKGFKHPMFYFILQKEATNWFLSNHNYLPVNLELVSDYVLREYHDKIFQNGIGNCLVYSTDGSSELFLNEEELGLYYIEIERLVGLIDE
jgi:hypothetical protein